MREQTRKSDDFFRVTHPGEGRGETLSPNFFSPNISYVPPWSETEKYDTHYKSRSLSPHCITVSILTSYLNKTEKKFTYNNPNCINPLQQGFWPSETGNKVMPK